MQRLKVTLASFYTLAFLRRQALSSQGDGCKLCRAAFMQMALQSSFFLPQELSWQT